MTDMSGSSTSSTGGDGSGSTGGGAGGGPCGACKFLRRKCISGCIFAPYFNTEQGAVQFAAVHKVFGASNVSKLLLHIPAHKRLDAVVTICYEAQARLRDPVYGCIAHIFALQQQIVNLRAELSYLQATLEQLTPQPPRPRTPSLLTSHPFSISDLSSSSLPANIDLSAPFAPLVQPEWSIRQHLMHNGSGSGDLQALARELIDQPRWTDTSDQPRPLPK